MILDVAQVVFVLLDVCIAADNDHGSYSVLKSGSVRVYSEIGIVCLFVGYGLLPA
jgi:hypothetical protein